MGRILFLFLLSILSLEAKQNRAPSFPFITGDGFRYISNHIYDETSLNMIPSTVQKGDIIFVKSDFIRKFYEEVHPGISCPYVLITHNGDVSAPILCPEILEEKNLIAWFAQNAYTFSHPKLIPIPIGIENRYNSNGDPSLLSYALDKDSATRTISLYVNFSVGTCPAERGPLLEKAKQLSCSYLPSRPKPYLAYLDDLSRSVFVLSPRGNGFDCHRTWEALYMGAIPIISHSAMDSLFLDLPVIYVDDWEELTEMFLVSSLSLIEKQKHQKNKLFMDYWVTFIRFIAQKGSP